MAGNRTQILRAGMTPESIQNRAEIFALMFEQGASYTYEYEYSGAIRKRRITFRTKHVCDVHLPTGKVVACDPSDGLFFGTTPFTRKARRGTYPVVISLEGPARHPRVAAARIEFDSAQPRRWEMALKPKQNTKRLKKREFFGFSVDGGWASIGDYQTYEIARKQHDKDDIWTSLVNFRTCQNWRVPASPTHNLAIFDAGYGDGAYPAFFGTTARGRVLCLLIDFFIIPWEY